MNGPYQERSALRLLCCVGCTWFVWGLPLTLAAQQRPPPTDNVEQPVQVVQEIVVTAQKREQRLIEVPFSMSAFDETLIEDANVNDVQDLVLLTPGLEITEVIGRQTAAPSIRGIAPNAFSDPTVVVFTDGFTLGFTRDSNNTQLLALERVEILKGPQATLYGRNALGGVINYITRKPSNEFAGFVTATYGSYDSYEATASLSGPLVRDKFFAGVLVGDRGFGGFRDNEFTGQSDVDDERDRSGRVSLRATPTENLEVDFAASYSEADDECGDCPHVFRAWNVSDPARFRNIGAGLFDFSEFDQTVNLDVLGGFTREDETFVLTAEYSRPAFTITNIAGFGQADTRVIGDSNRMPGPNPASGLNESVFETSISNEGWSDELRFASNSSGSFSWLFGLYTFRSARDTGTVLDATRVVTNTSVDITNHAAFASVDFGISETLSMALGLRYDYEKNGNTNHLSRVARETTFEEWLPRLSLSYRPSSTMHWYATVARGYHAGGFNAPNAPSQTFGAEFVWNYEIGLKGQFRDNRLQPQIAAYYIDWADQQITEPTSNPGIVLITNAGAARLYGLDISLLTLPTDRLQLTVALALADTKYTNFTDNVVAPVFGLDPDLRGNELPFAPGVSGAVSAQYVVPVGSPGWRARLRLDARYMGERIFDRTNLAVGEEYLLVNAYAGIQNERIELGLYGDNVFDEEYVVGGAQAGGAFPPRVQVGDPRIIGLRARYSF